jgi:hypothetical protein
MNAHGWELPAEGAHRAASKSASVSGALSSSDASKVVGL